MPSAVVTFNGRITLPTQVRKQLGLKTGDSVEFVQTEEGRFAIVPGPGSSLHLDRLVATEEAVEAVL